MYIYTYIYIYMYIFTIILYIHIFVGELSHFSAILGLHPSCALRRTRQVAVAFLPLVLNEEMDTTSCLAGEESPHTGGLI